ncbi:hypothetical protein [Acanthopleuribacter pedis]|uniref:Uncharacterized protein n=1 Tax=Acanthopleuribacter pedis TaxID=442870 RepID=A0A8J7U3D2_9BACT|nr:hypothetical protein [Acanthopleuribacter pedis]MBO1320268.1 hypothetical protein [Acanthopleuribacter pedis]
MAPEIHDRLHITDDFKPYDFAVNERPSREAELDIDPLYRDRCLIHAIHGGDTIPRPFYNSLVARGPDGIEDVLSNVYFAEKDWGTFQIAARLAHYLGLNGYLRINVARALMDFGRFPGMTPPDAGHLDRFAINYPFSYYLDHEQKTSLLQNIYDRTSRYYEQQAPGKLLILGVHTYDTHNPSDGDGHAGPGTVRPEVSIIYRALSFQAKARMPYGLFDRLFIDELAEFTADRRLTARMALTLEKNGIGVGLNFPYLLPNGSFEVRGQIWTFFSFLRERFENRYPHKRGLTPYELVWDMLMDTNLRGTQSEGLRSYLHMYREPPKNQLRLYRAAQRAYCDIETFLNRNRREIMTDFRFSPNRLSSLAIEVRKDLIWRFEDRLCRKPVLGPEGLIRENVDRIAHLISSAIAVYFNKDRGPILER